MEEFLAGMGLGGLIVLLLLHPWQPGPQATCNPGYHIVQTSEANHYRWYECKPIVP
jgi:hypothetical protein